MAIATHDLEPAAQHRPLVRALLGMGLGAATIVALRRTELTRGKVVAATATIAGLTALDLLRGQIVATRTRADHVRCTIHINRTPQDVYRFWRELQNLPRFLQRIEAIEVASGKRSRWRGVGSDGAPVEWDVELIADERDRRIAWCSARDAAVFHCGSVRFEPAPSGRGTSVRMDLQCAWPYAGWLTSVARLFGLGPEQEVKEDLRRFKRLMETGEIATTEGQTSGRARRLRS